MKPIRLFLFHEEDKNEKTRRTDYDDVIDRMDIRFGPLDYYGGLHCGERLEVLLDGEWIPTRIELGEFWYLKGVKLIKLNGLIVRIED